MARLDFICRIIMGASPDSSTYNDKMEGLPFYQGNADFGEKHPTPRVWCNAPTRIAEKDDVLISVRAPIGALNIATEQCCIGRGLAALAVNAEICDTAYLWYGISSKVDELNAKGTGSTFKAISRKALEETDIPLPDLPTQRRIAATLDKVSEGIVVCRQMLADLDTLIKTRFVEMFGDLKSNSKHWKNVSFTECAAIDTNMIHDFNGYEDYPHIGIDSIEKETGRLLGYRTVAEDGVISGKYFFTPQHIIYSKIRPNLNKVALPDFEGLCSADAYPILVNADVCTREYLGYTMRSSFFLDYILAFSNRTNLPKVNKAQVEGFSLPLPPMELQIKFVDFIKQVDKSKFVVQQQLAELETLKKSLMQEYYGGSL